MASWNTAFLVSCLLVLMVACLSASCTAASETHYQIRLTVGSTGPSEKLFGPAKDAGKNGLPPRWGEGYLFYNNGTEDVSGKRVRYASSSLHVLVDSGPPFNNIGSLRNIVIEFEEDILSTLILSGPWRTTIPDGKYALRDQAAAILGGTGKYAFSSGQATYKWLPKEGSWSVMLDFVTRPPCGCSAAGGMSHLAAAVREGGMSMDI